MCRKQSKTMRTIVAMCMSQNHDPDELYKKAKLMLNAYRQVCWASFGFCQDYQEESFAVSNEEIERALKFLEEYPSDIDGTIFSNKMKNVMDPKWLMELIDDTMLQVREYPDRGDLYFEIISKAYLNRFKYVETDIIDLLSVERSCYYDRKKEAIMVFAVSLWGTIIPKIGNMIYDINLNSESFD